MAALQLQGLVDRLGNRGGTESSVDWKLLVPLLVKADWIRSGKIDSASTARTTTTPRTCKTCPPKYDELLRTERWASSFETWYGGRRPYLSAMHTCSLKRWWWWWWSSSSWFVL